MVGDPEEYIPEEQIPQEPQAEAQVIEQPPIVHQTVGPFDDLALTTDVPVGEDGWLILGADGIPTVFQKAAPAYAGEIGCPARHSADPKTDAIVSLSGAPLSAPLNERPDIRFPPMPEAPLPP